MQCSARQSIQSLAPPNYAPACSIGEHRTRATQFDRQIFLNLNKVVVKMEAKHAN